MINLQKIFAVLNQEHKYAAVKLSEDFPKYIIGSELDIFCHNIDKVLLTIVSQMNSYVESGYEIMVEDKGYHISIDVMNDKKLEIRWNLYRSLPKLRKISIKDSLFDVVVERAIKKQVGKPKNRQIEVYVPEFYDDLLIRYIEFQEWYSLRGSKIKHADYIQSFLTTKNKRKAFFERVHYYTKLSDIEIEDAI